MKAWLPLLGLLLFSGCFEESKLDLVVLADGPFQPGPTNTVHVKVINFGPKDVKIDPPIWDAAGATVRRIEVETSTGIFVRETEASNLPNDCRDLYVIKPTYSLQTRVELDGRFTAADGGVLTFIEGETYRVTAHYETSCEGANHNIPRISQTLEKTIT